MEIYFKVNFSAIIVEEINSIKSQFFKLKTERCL
jgi:hypothetical protein